MFILIYLLILFGFVFSRGFFSLPSVLILLVANLFFAKAFFHNLNNSKQFSFFSIRSLLIILALLSIVLYGGLYQENSFFIPLSFVLLAFNLPLLINLAASKSFSKSQQIYFFVFLLAFVLRVFMVWSSPTPLIDVHDYLKNGALGLLQGKNPYSLIYTKFYSDVTPDFYSYLPAMLFLTLPSVVFFADPRYTFVFSELAVALLILHLLKNKKDRFIYSIIFLQNPISLYMIEQSYTEPLILLIILLAVFFIFKKKNLLIMIFLAVLISLKQYLLFLLPLFYKLLAYFQIKKKLLLFFGGVIFALLISLPFVIWNKDDFVHDAVLLQLKFPPRYEGLTFFSLLYYFTGIKYNVLISWVIITLVLLFIYTRPKITPYRFFYLSSFLYLVVFFFNKWAFLNYYYLISQLLLLGISFKVLTQ